jgi:hypothetical protein
LINVIVSRFALANVFRAEIGKESESLLAQNISTGEPVWGVYLESTEDVGNGYESGATWGNGRGRRLGEGEPLLRVYC